MHCEACGQEIKKRILRMKGVESAEAELKSSEVTVKGTFEAANLVDYVFKRIGKHAEIVKQDPPLPEKKEGEEKGKDGEDEKKGEDEGDKKGEKDGGTTADEEDGEVLEISKNEFYYHHPQNYQAYPARIAAELGYAYPPAPQMFSDENPNACSVM